MTTTQDPNHFVLVISTTYENLVPLCGPVDFGLIQRLSCRHREASFVKR
jgi:hypothetical protein